MTNEHVPFLTRLNIRRQGGSWLCVGLDPDPEHPGWPENLPKNADGLYSFCRAIIDRTHPYAAAYKPNMEFFLTYGPEGYEALIKVVEYIHGQFQGSIPVVLDCKKGDIGNTSKKGAQTAYDIVKADAVTLSPYVGLEALEPYLRPGKFAYLLCRTTNDGAFQVQGMTPDMFGRDPMGDFTPGDLHREDVTYLNVARLADQANWCADPVNHEDAGRFSVRAFGERSLGEPPQLGLVVGGNKLEDLRLVLQAAPTIEFLSPGIGAQGGNLEEALRAGAIECSGYGVLLNQSRSIAFAGPDGAFSPYATEARAYAENADIMRAVAELTN